MFDLFGWLRRKAREAVLGGISDAVSEVSAGDGPPDLERLRAMLAAPDAKALAAPADDAEPARKRK
jgi:hypothetical protein